MKGLSELGGQKPESEVALALVPALANWHSVLGGHVGPHSHTNLMKDGLRPSHEQYSLTTIMHAHIPFEPEICLWEFTQHLYFHMCGTVLYRIIHCSII